MGVEGISLTLNREATRVFPNARSRRLVGSDSRSAIMEKQLGKESYVCSPKRREVEKGKRFDFP